MITQDFQGVLPKFTFFGDVINAQRVVSTLDEIISHKVKTSFLLLKGVNRSETMRSGTKSSKEGKRVNIQ